MEKKTTLAGIFGDGMILQRDCVNRIWGEDSSADLVILELDGQSIEERVENGKFAFNLPPHTAAKNLELTVRGTETITCHDVCFGDVFLLSGQSNMELPVSRVLDESKKEIDKARDSLIRQYRLAPEYSFAEDQVSNLPAAAWTRAIPDEIMEMSAAGYFFAERIRKEKNVPVGLILNAQGGSSVEAWMCKEDLKAFGDFSKEIEPFLAPGSLDTYLRDRENRIEAWYRSVRSDANESLAARIPDEAKSTLLPALFSQLDGEPYSGSIWYYRKVILQKQPKGEALLYVGELIDSDQTYVNGQKVGETAYRYPPRKYFFDASILHEGENLIAVRLVVENGFGGFIPEHPYFLEVDGRGLELSGEWSCLKEKEASYPAVEGFLAQKIPTGLYRAAICPLAGLGIKGVLWYQGESNAGDPAFYNEKFAAMVARWRKTLSLDLPIVVTVLADYSDPQNGDDEGWRSIQNQQERAPELTAKCSVASAKDLGAVYELHPQKKKELGERLAEKALELFYS